MISERMIRKPMLCTVDEQRKELKDSTMQAIFVHYMQTT